MKTANRILKSRMLDVGIYRAFLGLDRDRRRRLALRILRNQKILADLYDHFLIEQSLREAARNTSWKAYLSSKNSRRR